MVVQIREEFGKERESNLLGTEKRLEEDTYITFPLKRGERSVFRQTEIARKIVGKTEIIPKPAAAGNGNWSTASQKFYYYFLFSQVLHFLKDSIQYFAIFSSKYALNNIDR